MVAALKGSEYIGLDLSLLREIGMCFYAIT
jgi:hypothetical protein